MALIPHIHSSGNVTVYLDGSPHVVAGGTPQYDLVLKAIEAGDIEAARDAIEIRKAVVKMSQGKIELDGTTLKYDGRPLHNTLVDKILGIVKAAGNVAPLLLYLENLMQNPSFRAVQELYTFNEKANMPITKDGCFLAYKKVRSDYKDIYSGTMDNSVGKVLSVPRNSVDENKDNTCSYGLHFCSKSYLSSFGSSPGNRVVVVKINPADVVAIPSDYNNAKGRTCRYEVVGELKVDDNGRTVVDELSADFDDSYASKPVKVAAKPAVPAPIAPAKPAAPNTKTFKPTPKPATPVVFKPTASVNQQSAVGATTLTDSQVREIRKLLTENWPLTSIAKSVGTSARSVARIRDGETYTHVK